jgi:hypothetical protein
MAIGKYGVLTPDEAREKRKNSSGPFRMELIRLRHVRMQAVRTFKELSDEFLRLRRQKTQGTHPRGI